MKNVFLATVMAFTASVSNAVEFEQQHYSFSLLSDSLGPRPAFIGEMTRHLVSGPNEPGISLIYTSFASGSGNKSAQVSYPAGGFPIVASFFDVLTIFQSGGYEDKTLTITNNRYRFTDIWTNRPELNSTDTGVLVFTSTVPIPEPETYALMLCGLGVVAWAVRKKQNRSGSKLLMNPSTMMGSGSAGGSNV